MIKADYESFSKKCTLYLMCQYIPKKVMGYTENILHAKFHKLLLLTICKYFRPVFLLRPLSAQ